MSATVFLLIANIFQFLANLGDIVYPPLGIFVTFWTLRRRSEDNATINSTPTRPADSEFPSNSIDSSVVPTPAGPSANWVRACRTSLKEILESLDDISKKGLLDGTETKKRFIQLIDMQESLGVTVSNLARCITGEMDLDIRRNTIHDLIGLEQDVDDFANAIGRSRLKREARCDELTDAEEGLLSPLGTRPPSCDAPKELEIEPEISSELPAMAEPGSIAQIHSGSSDAATGLSICDQCSPRGVSTKLDNTSDHAKVKKSIAWRGRDFWSEEAPKRSGVVL